MKNTSIIVSIVAGVSLVVSVAMLSSAIKEFGRSLERASFNQPHAVTIPSRFIVSMEGGNSPMRFDVNSKP